MENFWEIVNCYLIKDILFFTIDALVISDGQGIPSSGSYIHELALEITVLS